VVTGSSPGSPVTRGTIPEAVTAAVERYIEAGRQAQLSDDVLLDLLRARLRKA
jgi:hypothetical protein